MEIWLRTNRRALMLGMILPVVLIGVGLLLAVGAVLDVAFWSRIVGWALVGAGLVLWLLIALQLRLPRLAYANRHVIIYLRSREPVQVPVEMVECFFLGTGTGQLPGSEGSALPVRNLLMRIAEKATEFQHRDVKPALGRWDEGYVTIHGAWCEQLTLEVVRRLNDRLAVVQRSAKQEQEA
jgi:hypothetical protein